MDAIGVHFHIKGFMSEHLTFSEHPGADFPYMLVLNDTINGHYVLNSFSLDAYISCLKLNGLYKELDTTLTVFVFTDKSDALQVKLGWDPNQDEFTKVSGPGW